MIINLLLVGSIIYGLYSIYKNNTNSAMFVVFVCIVLIMLKQSDIFEGFDCKDVNCDALHTMTSIIDNNKQVILNDLKVTKNMEGDNILANKIQVNGNITSETSNVNKTIVADRLEVKSAKIGNIEIRENKIGYPEHMDLNFGEDNWIRVLKYGENDVSKYAMGPDKNSGGLAAQNYYENNNGITTKTLLDKVDSKIKCSGNWSAIGSAVRINGDQYGGEDDMCMKCQNGNLDITMGKNSWSSCGSKNF